MQLITKNQKFLTSSWANLVSKNNLSHNFGQNKQFLIIVDVEKKKAFTLNWAKVVFNKNANIKTFWELLG